MTKPPEELGKNLLTVADVRTWLSHPSNQLETRLFIVKWDGLVPKVSVHHVERMMVEDGFCEVVIWEQQRRRRGGSLWESIGERTDDGT